MSHDTKTVTSILEEMLQPSATILNHYSTTMIQRVAECSYMLLISWATKNIKII